MLSCTDIEQSWGSLASNKADEFYTAKPLEELCCVNKNEKNRPSLSPEQHKQIFNLLVECKFVQERLSRSLS